jgi:hypothetical protein
VVSPGRSSLSGKLPYPCCEPEPSFTTKLKPGPALERFARLMSSSFAANLPSGDSTIPRLALRSICCRQRRFAVSPLAPYAIARAREGCSILTAPATARTVFHAPYPQHAQGGCSRVWRACTSTVVYGSIPAAVLDPFTVAESRELVLRQVWHSPTAS